MTRVSTHWRIGCVCAFVAITALFAVPRLLSGMTMVDGGWRVAFFVYAGVASTLFVVGMGRRLWVWTSGLRDAQPTTLTQALRRLLRIVLAQRRVLRRRVVGTVHALMFWSFVVLFVVFSLSAFGLPTGDLWRVASSVLYAAVALGGLFFAARIAFVTRRRRGLGAAETASRLVAPLLLAAIGISFFQSTRSDAAMFVHLASVMTFFALIPYSRLLHIVAVPLWNLVRPDRRLALRLPFDLSRMSEQEIAARDLPLGPRHRDEFPLRALLGFDACTQCGRCEDVCPAHGTGDAFSPTEVMKHLQRANAPTAAARAPGAIARDAQVDACTTCGHCEEACPVGLDPLSAVVDLRRSAAYEGEFEPGHGAALRRLAATGRPWDAEQAPPVELTPSVPWVRSAGEPPAELVYWTGCAGRHDPAGQRIAATIAGLLDRAGMRWTTPGAAASCTGDPARRMGDEGLFQQLALHNIGVLRESGCRRILVNCAHCFNALAKEYPAFGAEFDVIHHSELLQRLLAEGRFGDVQALPATVAFHDPCYLGRHNGRYDAPRAVLDGIAGLTRIELGEARERSRCCGAGGARLWREAEPGAAMATRRAGQAAETAADTLVTGCPFCLTMLEDPAAKQGLRAQDIAEVIAAAVRS
ncbi:MAG: 4Fe-4S dicluster domain-containing protein [Gammaproteobacteria bacterium]|nr:4Fe-4S dicluster domain-containing protein [Gammaproteobacteria bacterium]